MASPEPYRDEDPPPPGSPRLFGNMAALSRCKSPADMQGLGGGGMTDSERRRFRLKMLVAIGYHHGMPQTWIADALGKDHTVISDMCRDIASRLPDS